MSATDLTAELGNANIVRFEDVEFAWRGKDGFAFAIDKFVLPASRRMLLVGPSGSGKSTFLSLLCGILRPRTGRIEALGTDLTRLSESARDRFRAEHFGIIFQMFNLLPYGTIVDNILLPLSFAPGRRARAAAGGGGVRAEAARLLERLGLDPLIARSRSAANLSVGQQQRVAVARALIGGPELIVADEPTSALDRNRQAAFLDLLFAQVGATGSTLIMVSHDDTLGTRFDDIVHLNDIARTTGGAM